MIPLIITYVRRAMPEWCKGNATDLDRLSCENERLIGDVCLSSWCWIFKERDLCPIQDIDVPFVLVNYGLNDNNIVCI